MPRTGPKGGRSTRRAGGLIRKTLLLRPDQDAELRRPSYEQRSERELGRNALDAFRGLDSADR